MVSPVRILFVDHPLSVGGAKTVMLDLIAPLDRSRFEPIACVPPASPLSKLLDARGMEWCSLSMPRLNVPSPLMPVRWLSAARRLARLAREQRIDLIHANTVRAHLISALVRGTPEIGRAHV